MPITKWDLFLSNTNALLSGIIITLLYTHQRSHLWLAIGFPLAVAQIATIWRGQWRKEHPAQFVAALFGGLALLVVTLLSARRF